MRKSLIALILIVTVSGSISAGIQMHSGMHGAGMMDCCKAALAREDSAKTSQERLCCALNCQESAPLTSSSSQSVFMQGRQPAPFFNPETLVSQPNVLRHGPWNTDTPKIFSSPYILNLALLI